MHDTHIIHWKVEANIAFGEKHQSKTMAKSLPTKNSNSVAHHLY